MLEGVKRSRIVSVGPLRCLATISSATFFSSSGSAHEGSSAAATSNDNANVFEPRQCLNEIRNFIKANTEPPEAGIDLNGR